VRGDVAMTGEITLRGMVLPIGGLKEKSLAARRVGVKTVLMPKGNEREIAELPAVLREEITFVPVKEIDEVFDVVFGTMTAREKNSVKIAKKRSVKPQPLPVVPEPPIDRDGVRC
jgi:ATP-dependent Lon protease